jgi:hypothetical protein
MMTEEAKKACACGLNFNSLLKFVLGIFVVLLGIFLTVRYFAILKLIIAGCLGPFLILVGLVIIAIAKE